MTLVGSALLSMAFAAGPTVLVVPANPASRSTCEDLLEVFAAATFRVKLAGPRSEAVGCMARKGAGRAACLADAQVKAKVEAAVVVTAAPRGGQLAVTLQLVARSGEPLHQETVRGARARLPRWAGPALEHVLIALKAAQSSPPPVARADSPPPRPEPRHPPLDPSPTPVPQHPPPPVPVADAPRATVNLEPVPTSPVGGLTAPAPLPVVRRSSVPGWVLFGVAVVAAGAAGTFAGLGVSDRARLGQAPGGVSELSHAQAVALQNQTNLEFTVALGAGIGAAVAGATAGVLWLQ